MGERREKEDNIKRSEPGGLTEAHAPNRVLGAPFILTYQLVRSEHAEERDRERERGKDEESMVGLGGISADRRKRRREREA